MSTGLSQRLQIIAGVGFNCVTVMQGALRNYDSFYQGHLANDD